MPGLLSGSEKLQLWHFPAGASERCPPKCCRTGRQTNSSLLCPCCACVLFFGMYACIPVCDSLGCLRVPRYVLQAGAYLREHMINHGSLSGMPASAHPAMAYMPSMIAC